MTTGATGETTVGTGAEPTSARAALDCDRDRAAGSTRRWRRLWIIWSATVAVVAHYVNRRTGERTIETTRADRQRD